jgi:hypothetical protein
VIDRAIDSGVAVFIFDCAGLIDAAFEVAEHAIEDRSLFIVDPWLEERRALRKDKRFRGLLERAGLDEEVCPWLEQHE